MEKSVSIRDYAPQDGEDVKDLLVELQRYLVAADKSGVLALTQDYRERYFAYIMEETAAHDGKIIIAEADGEIVGLAAVKIFQGGGEAEITTNCPKIGFISDIVVKEGMRGRGIGGAVVAAAEKYFAEKGCRFSELEVLASNISALGLYKKCGYGVNCHYLLKPLV